MEVFNFEIFVLISIGNRRGIYTLGLKYKCVIMRFKKYDD